VAREKGKQVFTAPLVFLGVQTDSPKTVGNRFFVVRLALYEDFQGDLYQLLSFFIFEEWGVRL